jgi:DNA-binding NarL/FixJ family response regulator
MGQDSLLAIDGTNLLVSYFTRKNENIHHRRLKDFPRDPGSCRRFFLELPIKVPYNQKKNKEPGPMVNKYHLLLVEDQTILREGLCSLLSLQTNLEIVGEAGDGLEAIKLVDKLQPDLILMDLSMPRMGGVEAIMEIKKRWPGIKILALTVNESEEYISATLKAGAEGYVLKDSSREELIQAIQNVMSGNRVLSPGVSRKVIDGYLDGKKEQPIISPWDTLTLREREILKLIGEGHKNKEIADYLCISPNTVEKHRSNIMEKLNLHSASALTAYAIEKGLIVR